ncbi:hypothetical protein H310_04167 [Aphanomyces invadans]|uniref:Uncharacterized protein n=1 Tax=Aphanomyces invadans TaxID=157072 RepID=A0A024UG34_9STRA|nr:hypothetical protein H310_04167 [Aphanomyces invadans]ETW05165.1 hypothetical protein H310_04167 [Aphanomyces invadans]|eukprot:XP_008866603.1 hypothetical protein H310_04167 [Aphanomyces invadans]
MQRLATTMLRPLATLRRPAACSMQTARFSKLNVPVTSTQGRRNDYMVVEADIAGMQKKIRELYSKGDFVSGLEMAEICRDAVRDHFGDDHPVYASTLNNLALMQKNLSQLDEAIESYEAALRVYKSCVGENHASWATTLHNLGGVYRLQAHSLSGMKKVEGLDHALECFEESLRVRREILAADHPDIAMSMCNVGMLYWHTHKKEKAEEMLVEAVERLEAKVGATSPLTALAWNNLGIVYKELGKFDAAIELFAKATAVRKAALGELHVETITTMHNWAEALRASGRDDDAAEIQKTILDLVGDVEEVDETKGNK